MREDDRTSEKVREKERGGKSKRKREKRETERNRGIVDDT